MPFRTEGLGVDAGLMSFIQDTKRKTFRTDCMHVATKVPVKAGDQYQVSVEIDEAERAVSKLKIERAYSAGNFVIEEGCENLVISDPCYILQDDNDKWGEFCTKLHEKETHGRNYPVFIEHYGVKVAVSSSGYGDGYYDCNIETDDDGNLKEASIIFIGPDEEHEE